MKSNKFIVLTVVVLFSVLVVGYMKKDGTKKISKNKVKTAMEAGKSVYCKMSTTEGGTIETWTKGEKTKMYGPNVGGGMGIGYMISDGEWTYMWVEGSAKGSKYPVVDEETPRSEGEKMPGEMPQGDAQQELQEHMVSDYEFECTEQKISDSEFVPPSGVIFTDMVEEMGITKDQWSGNSGGSSLEDFKQQ